MPEISFCVLRAVLTSDALTTSSTSLDDKAANDAEDKATLQAALATQAAKAASLATVPADTSRRLLGRKLRSEMKYYYY